MDRKKFNEYIDEEIEILVSKLKYLNTEMSNYETINRNVDLINKVYVAIENLISLKEKI